MDSSLVEKIAKELFAAGGGTKWEAKPDWATNHYRKLAMIAIKSTREFYKAAS